jgi:hypothetical protein
MRRVRDILILAGFAALTAGLWRLHPRLEVDVENVAMSSDRSPEAAVEARRDARFAPDSTLLLLAERVGTARARAADASGERSIDARSAEAWIGEIAAAPGVRAARKLPVDALHGGLFVAADLAPDDSGAFVPAYRAAVAAARSAAQPGWHVSATGQVAGQAAISKALQAEGPRVLPILIAILALVLALTYRSASLLVAAFLPAGGAVVWVGGLEVLLGWKLDPISTLLQPTLLTVGVAAAVHVLEATLTERERGATADAAPGAAVRHVFAPVLLALLTTVAGFASLAFNAIPAVRSFGLLASVGVVVSCAPRGSAAVRERRHGPAHRVAQAGQDAGARRDVRRSRGASAHGGLDRCRGHGARGAHGARRAADGRRAAARARAHHGRDRAHSGDRAALGAPRAARHAAEPVAVLPALRRDD